MEKQTQSSSDQTVPSDPMPGPQTAARIGFEEFIEATSNAVLRAVEAHKFDETSQFTSSIGIVIGLIFFPGLGGALGQGQLGVTAKKEVTGE